MLIEELFEDPVGGLTYLERYVNDGSPSGFTYGTHQVSPAYRPREGVDRFDIEGFVVPHREGEISIASPDPNLARRALTSEGSLLFLHPDMNRPKGLHRAVTVSVAPTSSGRTVIVPEWGPPAFLKLHYAGILGRVPREMTRSRVRASVRMSAELDDLDARALLAPAVAYLPESLGVATGHGREEVGLVYRESVARPRRGDNSVAIPFFSLFSSDVRAPQDDSFLKQLLEAAPDPRDRFLNDVIGTILRSYLSLVFDAGLIPEYHAQNLLLEVGQEGSATRVVHRDLLDWFVDIAIRRELGLATDFTRGVDLSAGPERVFGQRSYAFDFRLGRYILDPLIAEYCRIFGDHESALKGAVRTSVLEMFAARRVDIETYFQPYDQVYFYDRTLEIWRDGAPAFSVKTGPTYR